MPLTDAQFESIYPNYRRRLFGHGFLPLRERALEKERMRPLFDACQEYAEPRFGDYRNQHGRDQLANDLLAKFGDDREKYGFAWVWVFAIILKVIASVLIDLWLVHGKTEAPQ